MAVSGRLEFTAAMHVLNVAATQTKWEQVSALLEDWYGRDLAEIFANLNRPLSEYEAWAWKIFTGDTSGMTPAERMAIGRNQRNSGFFMIVAGGVLILLTKGKATPWVIKYFGTGGLATAVTVGGFPLGGASITFGTAEALEGHHHMRLAEQGDIFSPTSNFLQDHIFNGNQALYDAFRNDISAATMIANLTLLLIPSVQSPKPARQQTGTIDDWLRDMTPEDAERYLRWRSFADAGLTPMERVNLLTWKYSPPLDLFLQHRNVFNNPDFFNQLTGEIVWPKHDGFFRNQITTGDLSPGTIIDRFGDNRGAFFAPDGLPLEQRAMSPTSPFHLYNRYQVLRPLPVRQGLATPWFNQPGMGMQFQLDPDFVTRIQAQLLDGEFLLDGLNRLGYLEILPIP